MVKSVFYLWLRFFHPDLLGVNSRWFLVLVALLRAACFMISANINKTNPNREIGGKWSSIKLRLPDFYARALIFIIGWLDCFKNLFLILNFMLYFCIVGLRTCFSFRMSLAGFSNFLPGCRLTSNLFLMVYWILAKLCLQAIWNEVAGLLVPM